MAMPDSVAAADFSSPLKSRIRNGGCILPGSTVWAPGGIITLEPLLTGHGRPSTNAGPSQARVTPTRDCTLDPFTVTSAAAALSSGQSGAVIERSKYIATRGNAAADVWINSSNSTPTGCLVG